MGKSVSQLDVQTLIVFRGLLDVNQNCILMSIKEGG